MANVKREYRRRSDEERISELEERINQLKHKMELKQREDSPVLREIPKIRRRLMKFAELALEHDREDLCNSTRAFLAGLERVLDGEDMPKRRGRPPKEA